MGIWELPTDSSGKSEMDSYEWLLLDLLSIYKYFSWAYHLGEAAGLGAQLARISAVVSAGCSFV